MRVLVLLLMFSVSCARSAAPFKWDFTLPDAYIESVEVPEDSDIRQVCIQWWIDDSEGSREWEYRCIPVDVLREQLFPEVQGP